MFLDWLLELIGLRRKPAPPPTPPPAPPQVPPTQPPAPHPVEPRLGLGYWYGDGRYGDHWGEFQQHTDVYHAWWQTGYWRDTSQPFDGPDGWKWECRRCVRRAAEAGKRIILLLDVGKRIRVPGQPDILTPGPQTAISFLKEFWDHIWLIDLYDESGWTAEQANAQANAVRTIIRGEGLAMRPVGVTLEYNEGRQSDIVRSSLDWFGIELYAERDWRGLPPGEVAQRVKARAREVRGRIPLGKGVVCIGQAYDRNGDWAQQMETVRRLQWDSYQLSLELGAWALTWFAYGRPGGTRDYKRLLLPEHLRVSADAGVFPRRMSS